MAQHPLDPFGPISHSRAEVPLPAPPPLPRGMRARAYEHPTVEFARPDLVEALARRSAFYSHDGRPAEYEIHETPAPRDDGPLPESEPPPSVEIALDAEYLDAE